MTMTKHLHIKDYPLTLVLTLITRLGCKKLQLLLPQQSFSGLDEQTTQSASFVDY